MKAKANRLGQFPVFWTISIVLCLLCQKKKVKPRRKKRENGKYANEGWCTWLWFPLFTFFFDKKRKKIDWNFLLPLLFFYYFRVKVFCCFLCYILFIFQNCALLSRRNQSGNKKFFLSLVQKWIFVVIQKFYDWISVEVS